MKKILSIILLGFLALNTNLFAMEKNEDAQKNVKTQLTKMDKVKIAAASLGCALFGWAALAMYPLRESIKHDLKLVNAPSVIMGGLFYYFGQKLLNCAENDENMNTCMALGGITSGILASGLGTYVYKKLSVLRSNKSAQEKIK